MEDCALELPNPYLHLAMIALVMEQLRIHVNFKSELRCFT